MQRHSMLSCLLYRAPARSLSSLSQALSHLYLSKTKRDCQSKNPWLLKALLRVETGLGAPVHVGLKGCIGNWRLELLFRAPRLFLRSEAVNGRCGLEFSAGWQNKLQQATRALLDQEPVTLTNARTSVYFLAGDEITR